MNGFEALPTGPSTDHQLLQELDPALRPCHVAFIMDGNGRWAAHRGLPRIAGHREGLLALEEILETCHEVGIPHVTIYAFSHENWNRPETEISMLMELLEEYLRRERRLFQEKEVKFLPIGRLDKLPPSIQQLIQQVAEETRHHSRRTLTVALSYGGRAEIVDAVRKLTRDVQLGLISSDGIDEQAFQRYLSTAHTPDPDLLIRTSGETRISNFLLWQIAYTELYFTKTLWPDFRRRELFLALLDYQKRERRFGRVSHALSQPSTQ